MDNKRVGKSLKIESTFRARGRTSTDLSLFASIQCWLQLFSFFCSLWGCRDHDTHPKWRRRISPFRPYRTQHWTSCQMITSDQNIFTLKLPPRLVTHNSYWCEHPWKEIMREDEIRRIHAQWGKSSSPQYSWYRMPLLIRTLYWAIRRGRQANERACAIQEVE